MKITKTKIKELIMEALKERILEGYVEAASGDVTSQLAGGIQGAVFDILEEMGAERDVVEQLRRVGEMSPEAEATNAAILAAVRKGAEDYDRKLGLMGGPKPVVAGYESDLYESDIEEGSVHREIDPVTGKPIGGVTDDAGKVPWKRQAAEDAERAKKRAGMASDAMAALRAARLKNK